MKRKREMDARIGMRKREGMWGKIVAGWKITHRQINGATVR